MPDSKTIIAVAMYLAITGLLNLIIGHKSQIDAWAESKPRLAAVLKLLRSAGFDPWMLIQSVSLAVSKRLPASVKSAPDPLPEKSSIGKLPPLTMLCIALLIFGCASAPKPGPCEVELADLVKECRARVKTGCDHNADGTAVESCPVLKECDARIDAWKECR